MSVVVDERTIKKRGKVRTLHSFGLQTFEAMARAELFRATCEVAVFMHRRAVTKQAQEAVFKIFGGLVGIKTLEHVLQIVAPAASHSEGVSALRSSRIRPLSLGSTKAAEFPLYRKFPRRG